VACSAFRDKSRRYRCSATGWISDDILVDLVAQDFVIGLVDFDDFLDPAMDVLGKEGFDRLRGHGGTISQKIFGR
jgi:hypothetical protein